MDQLLSVAVRVCAQGVNHHLKMIVKLFYLEECLRKAQLVRSQKQSCQRKASYLILRPLKLLIEAGEGLEELPSHSLDLKVHVLAAVALSIS